jgi:hypothetical protein
VSWKTELKLSDLPPAQRLEITCRRCGHSRYETARALLARPNLRHAYLDEAEQALMCGSRFCRSPVRIAITHIDKIEGFVGGMS